MIKKPLKKATLDPQKLDILGTEYTQVILEFHELLKILKEFGLLSAYNHLEHSEAKPEACLKRTSRSLDLLAFHGEKWLFEDWFELELDRLRRRQGKVRFLLSSTSNEKTVEKCIQLMRSHKVFSVRLFDDPAIFRCVIVDDRFILLGHYGHEVIEKDGENAKGWKSPQLYIEDNGQWSLLIPFRGLFRTMWDRASEISVPENTAAKRRDFHPTNEEQL
jgi:hypothetical protein